MIKPVIKKVIIITIESFPHGMAGTNRIISLGKGFIANGLDVQILSTYKFGDPKDKSINPKSGVYEGVKYTNIYNSTIKSRFKIIRVINKISKSFLVFYYCLKNLRKETLVIYYSHESFPALAVKVVAKIRNTLFYKEETEHPLIRIRDERLNKYIFLKFHYKIFDGLFVISDGLNKYFKEELKYKRSLFIVPMIVDVDRFSEDVRIDSNCIVFSGELNDQKEGTDMLIRAFSRINKKHPDYTLNLYGKANNQNQEIYYKAMIADLGLEKSVIMHGYKSRDEMTEIFLKAGILVFTRPSSLQATYGFSTKLGEYLASGKPVLVTRVGEIEKYLKDRINAFICDPNDESIVIKLMEIIEDNDFAIRVGKEGRKCALEHFNNKVETKRVLTHIQNIDSN
ncbi:MAG: glycosyltransferase [Bacteroidales bacterium]|nr:glycosyltransferase [Bacteroidales bacterium]